MPSQSNSVPVFRICTVGFIITFLSCTNWRSLLSGILPESSALLSYYAASSGSSLRTFWNRYVVPERRQEITAARCVLTQKNAVLISRWKPEIWRPSHLFTPNLYWLIRKTSVCSRVDVFYSAMSKCTGHIPSLVRGRTWRTIVSCAARDVKCIVVLYFERFLSAPVMSDISRVQSHIR